MCGIAGFFSARPLEDAADRHIAGMAQTLAHRGPDGDECHLERDKGLALGHTRLAINDLAESGEQPLTSPDGRYLLTVNGELYDFKKHRARLMADGDRFVSKCDSEIATGLYRKHGLAFVEHLRGEFAFALFDREKEELILVRDRFGIRPLFFHLADDLLVWGSEAKAVLAHPRVPRKLSRQAAMNQMMHTMVPGTSAFEGVHCLEPGHLMVVRRRGDRLEVQEQRYWDLDFPAAEDHERDPDPEEHIHRVREALIEAIVLRLEADVPVGCYLSGGIDSCSILGLATGAQQSPVKAFTISFDDQDYDEAAIANEMADSMQAEQETIHLKAADLYGENYLATAWHAERTFYNTLGVAKWCMSRRVRECGYKTVITGEGSDELFGGYPAFKRDMFQHGLADQPARLQKELLESLERSNELFQGAILTPEQESHPAFDRLCGFTPSWLQPWLATWKQAKPLFHPDVREEMNGYDPVEAIAERLDAERLEGRHPLDKAQYTWSKTMLEGQILNWGGDRVDMANSMESRPAFLDHYVAAAAVRLPPSLRIHGSTEKWVLREAVRGVLPEVLYKREKFAFMAPPAHTDERKKKALGSLVDRFLDRGSVERAGLFDADRIETFLDDYRVDTDPVALNQKDKVLNHLLCLHILHDQYIEGNEPRMEPAQAGELALTGVRQRKPALAGAPA